MQVGSRVGAIRNSNESTVYLFGWGVYVGHQLGAPSLGEFPNPKIELDGGGVVWGCECWWGSEQRMREAIEGREVVIVPLPERKNHDIEKT